MLRELQITRELFEVLDGFELDDLSFLNTFCTRMAEAGMDPKSLQYIMGHANITMTLAIMLTLPLSRRLLKCRELKPKILPQKSWRRSSKQPLYYTRTTFVGQLVQKKTVKYELSRI